MAKIEVWAIFLFLFLDRLSKRYILGHPNFYLGDFIDLRLFENRSFYFISFGKLTNVLIILASTAVLLLILILFLKTSATGLLFIILGGASNLFDRIYYGFAIDWIKLFFLPFSVFNIADLIIIAGILCLIFNLKKYRLGR
jgi:signal peptidase II